MKLLWKKTTISDRNCLLLTEKIDPPNYAVVGVIATGEKPHQYWVHSAGRNSMVHLLKGKPGRMFSKLADARAYLLGVTRFTS